MKTLFFCNTNYQLIIAMQIAVSFDKDCSIIITNEIKNCEEIVKNLCETKLFDRVVCIDVKTAKKSFTLTKQCISGNAPEEIKDCVFDEFVGFNFDIPSHIIYAYFYEKNKKIIVNKMEEGLMSFYTPETTCGVIQTAGKIRRFLKKRNLKDKVSGFYCFLPEANKSGIPSIQIPLINQNSEISQYLNAVFCRNIKFTYKEKYIFLSCIYDIEGGEPIGELELAKMIADRVGKENLLVKVHPRDNKEKYIDAGLKVDENSVVPFEVIQINNDFSDKVLITTLSGSVLNFNSVLEAVPKSYYGYELCKLERNPLALHYKEVLEQYLSDKELGLRNMYVLKSVEEL